MSCIFEWRKSYFELVIRHLHLHVISTDFVSPPLKTKKHYNSFHPTLGFFLPLDSVIRSLQESHSTNTNIHTSTRTSRAHSPTPNAFDLVQYCKPDGPRHEYEPLLKRGLRCCHCREEFGNIPALKRHLVEEWERVKTKAAGRQKKEGKNA